MVATIAAGTSAGYYFAQSEYYLGRHEPPGQWIAAGSGFAITQGSIVERAPFERLHSAIDADGKTLLSNGGERLNHVPGYDMTSSAPKSVSVLWALSDEDLRARIERVQAEAVKSAVSVLEKNAAFSRRGRNGLQIEAANLRVATFQHGEARSTVHSDGRTFADPQLHTHAVILNLARRADGTIGTLDGRRLFAWKMATGAAYHLALASGLQELGFHVCDIGRNGMFKIAGVDGQLTDYFSARRAEVVAELDQAGLASAAAPAFAGAITKASRKVKATDTDVARDRFALWHDAAREQGYEADRLVDDAIEARDPTAKSMKEIKCGQAILDQVKRVPDELTQSESVFERRHLMAAVASTMVGSGLSVERAEQAVEDLVAKGSVVELGANAVGEIRYSTPEIMRIEREILTVSQTLVARSMREPDRDFVQQLISTSTLTSEQSAAVAAATSINALAVIEGAAGSGKTTSLRPVVEAHRAAGYRVLGSATAWRIAHQLRDDLGIEAKATDAWLAGHAVGNPFLDKKTLLIVDEAGQLSSRQMHAVLFHVEQSGAKVLLVGDRRQLQPIGPGGALSIVARASEFARVDQIVRQREEWARSATMTLASGNVAVALSAYAERGHVHLHVGETSAVKAMTDAWYQSTLEDLAGSSLLLARTNGQVREINTAVRSRLREAGTLRGTDVAINAVTSSGQRYCLDLAVGDEIRFLVCNDDLGVINGTTGVVTEIRVEASKEVKIAARIGSREVQFSPSDIADDTGRAKLSHAYASTVYGAQGLTVDRTFVLLDPTCDRHVAYVALSRARDRTEIFADQNAIDAGFRAELPLSQRACSAEPEMEERLTWLSGRLSRAAIKGTTLDHYPPQPDDVRHRDQHRQHQRNLTFELEQD